jgi:hypothetical protein
MTRAGWSGRSLSRPRSAPEHERRLQKIDHTESRRRSLLVNLSMIFSEDTMLTINVMTRGLRLVLYRRRFVERHPERVHESLKRWSDWRVANPEKVCAANRKRYAANPEPRRATSRRLQKAYPETTRAKNRRRRAVRRGLVEHFTETEWQTLKRQYRYRCVACLKTEVELKSLGRLLVPDQHRCVGEGWAGRYYKHPTAVPRAGWLQQQETREIHRLSHRLLKSGSDQLVRAWTSLWAAEQIVRRPHVQACEN